MAIPLPSFVSITAARCRPIIKPKIENCMFDKYIVPVLIVVAGLIVYNMVAKKLLKLDTFDDSYEVTNDGRIVNMAA